MNKTSNLPINPTELLKQQLAQANERVGQSEARRIQITIAGFKDPQENVGQELNLVVVDFTLIHSFFDTAYDENNIVPPICYANNRQFAELAPVKLAPKPQADYCAVCPQNVFGSAPNGRAKACRNSRLLAVLPVNAIDKAPMWTFSVAPTSTKRWDTYVRELMSDNLTPMFAATNIKYEVAGKYAKPIFALSTPLDTDEIAATMARLEEARKLLDIQPDWSEKKK